jgi:predicted nuclease of predicted toxin-antitoxin system
VRFLVDNQLPAALARYLTARGVECAHVLDVDLGDAADAEIWAYAVANSAVVISKDEDFLYLANRSAPSARLIWVRLGNCRTKALLAAFESAWPKIESAMAAGDRIIELR